MKIIIEINSNSDKERIIKYLRDWLLDNFRNGREAIIEVVN